MKKLTLSILALAAIMHYVSCSKDSTTNCGTTTISYSGYIAPLMTVNCATSGCHNSTSKADGIDLSSYAGVKEHASHVYEAINNGSMPKGGSKLPDSTIAKVKSWVDACAPNN